MGLDDRVVGWRLALFPGASRVEPAIRANRARRGHSLAAIDVERILVASDTTGVASRSYSCPVNRSWRAELAMLTVAGCFRRRSTVIA